MYILERFVGFHISDLADKWMRTIRLAANYQLCHDNGMIRCPSKRPDPPFGRSQIWRVKGEGLVLGVPGRSCLETSDIRARAEKLAYPYLVLFQEQEEQKSLLQNILKVYRGCRNKEH